MPQRDRPAEDAQDAHANRVRVVEARQPNTLTFAAALESSDFANNVSAMLMNKISIKFSGTKNYFAKS